MAPAIARYLPDFSSDLPPRSSPPPAPARPKDGLALLLRTPPAAPPEDREALIRAAEARGREAGRVEAEAEAAARLAAAMAGFDAHLTAVRRDWCANEADRLASTFALAMAGLGAGLTDRVGRLLAPVLTDALRRQAMDELSATLARLLTDPHHAPLRVSGPADLLEALAVKLAPHDASVTFTPADTVEVVAQADQTVIETQLGAWAGLLAAAVEGA